MAAAASFPGDRQRPLGKTSGRETVRPWRVWLPWETSARLLSELARPTEKLPFNVLFRGPQN